MSWLVAGRRSTAQLDDLVDVARHRDPTYDHTGSTLGTTPDGITERTFRLHVEGDLRAAASTLHRWRPHSGIGAHVHPVTAWPGRVEEGDTVLVLVPVGPIEAIIPNRIIAVVDDGDRVGIAYGTLPGHPETGEELFRAEHTAPGALRLTVRIHARPATPIVRCAGPVATRLQALAARRYLAAWSAAITEETT